MFHVVYYLLVIDSRILYAVSPVVELHKNKCGGRTVADPDSS